MPWRKGLFLGGLLTGLAGGIPIAGFVAAHLSSDIVEKARREARRDWQLAQAVVSRQELAPGEAITYDGLTLRPFPARMLTSSLIRPDDGPRIYNQLATAPIQAGELVRWGFVPPRPMQLELEELQIAAECEHALESQPDADELERTVDQIRERMIRGSAR
jgi:hypothetical protein